MTARPWLSSYDADVPRSIAFENVTIPDMLARSAVQWADAPAMYFMGRRISYAELMEQVDRFATALAGLGAGKGTRVAIQLLSLPQTVIAYQAALKIGAEVVLTNPLYTTREIEHQWKDAGCTLAIVADYVFEQKIRADRGRLPIQEYVIASIPEFMPFPVRQLAPLKLRRTKPLPSIATVTPGPHIHFFKALLAGTPPNPPAVTINLDDIAVLQYTGGTTGVSKGAMLTHRNLSANVQQTHAWLPSLVPGREVMLAALPMFHVFGMTVCMNLTLSIGGMMVLILNPRDIKAIIAAMEKQRVTIGPLTPAHFNAIGQTRGIDQRDLTSVRICVSGSAPLSVDVQDRFEKLTGGRIAEGYGLSETSPVTHVNPIRGRRKIGTIGVAVPDTDCRLVDIETGAADVAPGEPGELLIKGPQVMAGYWNQPEETAHAIRDGWFHTGDLATMDEDGFFRIVGRKKEMIDAAGYKIYPDEIDRVLMSHPAVLESATIGVPDPRRGETVKSFVVLKPGRQLSAAELVAFCRTNLAAYKVPRAIEFRSELPRNAAMKLLRRELREQELAKMGATA